MLLMIVVFMISTLVYEIPIALTLCGMRDRETAVGQHYSNTCWPQHEAHPAQLNGIKCKDSLFIVGAAVVECKKLQLLDFHVDASLVLPVWGPLGATVFNLAYQRCLLWQAVWFHEWRV